MTDYTKLIERLRKVAGWLQGFPVNDLKNATDAIEATQAENERLKAFAELGVAMYEMTTTVHSPNIDFAEKLKLVPSMWSKCMEERDTWMNATAEVQGLLQAKLDELTKLEPLTESKPHCQECAEWRRVKQADKEWHKDVAKGREIVASLAKGGNPAPKPLEPLTKKALIDAFCVTPNIRQFVTAFVEGARFAEKHHGITKGTPT